MTPAPVTPQELLADCRTRGIRLSPTEGGGLEIDYPSGSLPQGLLAEIRAHKRSLIETLESETNEEYWGLLFETDRNFILTPRDQPDPCPWCRARLTHHPACVDLRREWAPVIAFGKHRGKRVDQVPSDYLRWVLSRKIGSDRFRKELQQWRSDTRQCS